MLSREVWFAILIAENMDQKGFLFKPIVISKTYLTLKKLMKFLVKNIKWLIISFHLNT